MKKAEKNQFSREELKALKKLIAKIMNMTDCYIIDHISEGHINIAHQKIRKVRGYRKYTTNPVNTLKQSGGNCQTDLYHNDHLTMPQR